MTKCLLITAILLASISFAVNAQITTLYEFGQGTGNSIYSNFEKSISIGGSGTNPNVFFDFYENGNSGVDGYMGGNGDLGKFCLMDTVSEIANYTSLTFYVDYTISIPEGKFNILTSLDNALSFGFSLDVSANGNLVAVNPATMQAVAYQNTMNDSILKIIFAIPFLTTDTVFYTINYIRIDADLSSYHSAINEVFDDNFETMVRKSDIQVTSKKNEPFELMVCDVLGREIFNGNYKSDAAVNLNNKSGIYILKVISQGKSFTKKIYLN